MTSKKLISHFDLNVFSRVVWILSQFTAFALKLQQKKLHGRKSTAWSTALITQYLLNLLECCLLYSAVDFFIFFNKADGGFHGNGLSICVFTNTMNNCVHLKGRELQLLDLFFFNHIRNASLSSIGMCCLCLFFDKTKILGENPLKICKTVKIKKLT